MAQAVITWTPQTGVVSQEIYYGKKSVVTGDPETGTGWTPVLGNPLTPTTNTYTQVGLENFFKYRFFVYSVMPGGSKCSTEIEDITYTCGSIDYSITGNVLDYTLSLPALINGTDIGTVRLTLIGYSTAYGTYQTTDFTTPFSATYTGSFPLTPGFTYTILARFLGDLDGTIVNDCVFASFTTPAATAGTAINFENGMSATGEDVRRLYIKTNWGDAYVPVFDSGPTNLLHPDAAVHVDLGAGVGAPRYYSVLCPGVSNGTTLFYQVQRNAGATTPYQGSFVYNGTSTNIVAQNNQMTLQDGDTLMISDHAIWMVMRPVARIDLDISNNYIVEVALAARVSTNGGESFDVTFTGIDHHGNTETFTKSVIVPKGSRFSNTVYQASGLASWPKVAVISSSVTPTNTAIGIPVKLQAIA